MNPEKLNLGITAKKGAGAGLVGGLALWAANALVTILGKNGVAVPLPVELVAGGLIAGYHALLNVLKQKKRERTAKPSNPA